MLHHDDRSKKLNLERKNSGLVKRYYIPDAYYISKVKRRKWVWYVIFILNQSLISSKLVKRNAKFFNQKRFCEELSLKTILDVFIYYRISILSNSNNLSFLNPFVPNAPFVYPLKTSENHKVFWCFHGVEKRCIGNEWVNLTAERYFNIYFQSEAYSESLWLLFHSASS